MNIRFISALAAVFAIAVPRINADDKGVTQYINPFIGTGSVDAQSLKGGTFPGAACPFGMIQLSPDMIASPDGHMAAGYDYNQNRIYGFSHTHLSGTGIADLQDVQIMPATRSLEQLAAAKDYSATFSHSNESATVGYYDVTLDNPKVRVELTAAPRAGMSRITYPAGEANNLVIDLTYAPAYVNAANYAGTGERRLFDGQIRILSPTAISGYRLGGGWARLRKVYFYAEFSRPIVDKILTANKFIINKFEADTLRGCDLANGNEIKAFLSFAPSNEPLLVKVAVSSVSCENAKQNLHGDAPDFNFDGMRRNAVNLWEKELANIRIDGTEKQKRIFYTALYHAYVQPTTLSDRNGEYTAPDYTTAIAPQGQTQYTTFSLWDTYRAAHPLYTLLKSERVPDMVNSMLRFYDHYGYLPIWELWGTETYCMIGNHAISVLVDAVLKGIKGIDAERVYEAVRTSSLREHHNSPFSLLRKYGYIPVDLHPQSVSIALEMAYEDACVARLAKFLGKTADYEYFNKRAHLYRNLFDPSIRFFRARNSDGSWQTPFNPLEYGATDARPFTEGNAWQYRWYVPQDVPDLIKLMGGKKAFEKELDRMFTVTNDGVDIASDNISGTIGQYVHGNEPSHQVLYMYDFIGADHKAQYYTNKVLNEQYTDDHAGYTGNDDCGQMSAWYVFGCMGFYPVDPASGVYYFGSPQMRKITISLPAGKTFTITTNRRSKDYCYIKSVKLNGRTYKKNYITHADIMRGGTLEFVMRK